MRMKVSTRIILTIYLVVVILLCAFIIAVAVGLIPSDYLAGAVGTIINGDLFYKILYIVICAAMIVFGFIIMFFGIGKGKNKKITLSSSENGSVSMSIEAFEELVNKYVNANPLVKNIKTAIRCSKNMPVIELKVAVPPQTDIPAVTNSLQSGLVEYLEKYTGAKVKDASVSVIQIDDSIDNSSAAALNKTAANETALNGGEE